MSNKKEAADRFNYERWLRLNANPKPLRILCVDDMRYMHKIRASNRFNWSDM